MTDYIAERKVAAKLVKSHPYGVMHSLKGWVIYEIQRVEKVAAVCKLRHDTSRDDPTLVADVLAERLDPEHSHTFVISQFRALFKTLDEAIAAIDAFELRYGWQRKHARECKKAVELARRNLVSAEQSLEFSALTKLDTFNAESQASVCFQMYNQQEK